MATVRYFIRHSFHRSVVFSRFGPHQSALNWKPFLMFSGADGRSGPSLGSTYCMAFVLVGPYAMYFVSSACGFGCSAQLINFMDRLVFGAPFGTTQPS